MLVSEQIIQVLDNLCQKFGIAFDWANENVIPYIQELMTRYIHYKISMDIVGIVVGIMLIIATIVLIKLDIYAHTKFEESDGDSIGWAVMFYFSIVAQTLMGLIGITVIGTGVCDLIQNIFVPEITVYEYITGLMQSIK